MCIRDRSQAALLAAVADPIRLQLLNLLVGRPRCVCNLQPDPPIPTNLLSYHLKVLRKAGLIEGARRGRWIDYSLTEGALAVCLLYTSAWASRTARPSTCGSRSPMAPILAVGGGSYLVRQYWGSLRGDAQRLRTTR